MKVRSKLKSAGKRAITFILALVMVISLIPGGLFSPNTAEAQMSVYQMTDANIIDVQPGSHHYTALDDEGRVWTWGEGNSNQLGRSTSVTSYSTGGQVTETADGGELPYIIQVASSYVNSYALDRDGNIWSWGRGGAVALGRTNTNANRPGKVTMPTGVTAVYIAGGIYGCKFIDQDGNIWVFGVGDQNSLGTGNTSDQSTPVQLTLDSDSNPLPTNFKWVTSSDYYNACSAMAITEDGEIYTWGATTQSSNYTGSTRPKYVGTYQNVSKITCGNGSFGFITEDGEIYTWGLDNASEGRGVLGQGYLSTPGIQTPTKIQYVGDGTTPAPVFEDFSLYAWSSVAVDVDGNIYGAGTERHTKHSGIGRTYYLTQFTPSFVTDSYSPQIFIVEEGWNGTQFIDVYGNCYSTGSSKGGGTTAEPWAHFTSITEKAMFTSLDSDPSSESKVYDSRKATLTVETNRTATEVKYVILYDSDTETYTDGERYYDKSNAILEAPYYNAGTDPQLLLSPNYNLFTSRYYANSKITEDVFESIYNVKSGSEKGTMTANGSQTTFTAANVIGGNCIVWVQTTNSNGTTRMIYRFNNYYTPATAWYEGVKADDTNFNLYDPEVVSGDYGYLLDSTGNIIADPELGYDTVTPVAKALDYWELDPADQSDKIITLDDTTYGLYRLGDASTQQPRVTYTYSKIANKWADVTLHFVDQSGNSINVDNGSGGTMISQTKNDFAPIGIAFNGGQDPYTPPDAQDSNYSVVGYKVSSAPDTTGTDYTQCNFPDGFDAVVNSDSEDMYIVYKLGTVAVTESYVDISESPEAAITNNSNQFSVVNNMETYSSYSATGPAITNYVLVGHRITSALTGTTPTTYLWDSTNQEYTSQAAVIASVEEATSVEFLYKKDTNRNGIPDDEEGKITAYWMGVNATGSKYTLGSKTYVGNANQGDSATINGNTEFPTSYDYSKWAFRAGSSSDVAPYLPEGSSNESDTFTFSPSEQYVYFYYEEDYNENGIADKNEGKFTEEYLEYDDTAISLQAATSSKWLGGNTYSKSAPKIQDYVSVGYEILVGGVSESKVDYIDYTDTSNRNMIGNVSVTYNIPLNSTAENYTVKFLYKEDHNNNGIPDDGEGTVTVKWIGTTYGGTLITLDSVEIVGWRGDDVTSEIYPTSTIDTTVWKYVEDDIPPTVTLTDVSQSYEYKYSEIINFATVTIKGHSTDEKLNYEYPIRSKLDDPAYTVTALTIPGYKVTNYTITDDYGTDIDSGTGDTATIDPSNGNMIVEFTYVSTTTSVLVRAIDSDTGNVLDTASFLDATIGEPYSATAVHVNGYVLDSGQDILKVINPVQEGTNTVDFYYSPSGAVTVELWETDGSLICSYNVTTTGNVTHNAYDTYLNAAYYIFDSANSNNASEPVAITDADLSNGRTVEFYYTKAMMDVTVKAVDENGDPIGTDMKYTAAARKGEMYTATAQTIFGYSLSEEAVKTVYVDPDTDPLVVTFEYKKDQVGDITVRHYYVDENENKQDLQKYTVEAVVGSQFSVSSGTFDGFELASGEESSYDIIVENSNTIEFKYNDVRETVTVKVTKDGAADNSLTQVTKVPKGTENYIVYPNSIEGYVLVSYVYNGGSAVTTGLSSINLGTIDSSKELTLNYLPIEDVVSDYTVSVDVKGTVDNEAATQLYSYTKTPAKNAGDYEITPFSQSGYKLTDVKVDGTSVIEDSGKWSNGVLTVSVAQDAIDVEFVYTSLSTFVTIKMVDGNGTEIANSFKVSATTGDAFTYYAPSVDGYYYVSNDGANGTSVIGQIDSTQANAGSVITFKYAEITSKVTLIAKEQGTNTVIAVYEVNTESITADGSTVNNYTVPTIDTYKAVADKVDIVWDRVSSLTVEAYYTKNLVDITVKMVDAENGESLGTKEITEQRDGEVITVTAPDVSGYVLDDAKSKVIVAKDNGEVEFKYSKITSKELAVKAVSTDGYLLDSYVIKVESTTTDLVVNAFDILGWKLKSGSDSQVTWNYRDSEEIVFTYEKDEVGVTVQAVEAGTDGVVLKTQEVTVANGGDYTAYAPHVAGYVLAAGEPDTYSLTSVNNKAVITFYYTAIEDVVSDYTVAVDVKGTVDNEAATQLYSYTKTPAKNAGDYEITPFSQSGYKLTDVKVDGTSVIEDSGKWSNGVLTVSVAQDAIDVEFVYTSLGSYVTIKLIDADTGAEIDKFSVEAEAGEPYTYLAPNVSEYYLVTSSNIGYVASVADDSSSVIEFEYKKIKSGVTLILKENDTNGSVIRVVEVDTTGWSNEQKDVAVPDISGDYYTYLGNQYDAGDTSGIISIDYKLEDTPIMVEVYYSKDTVNVNIVAKENDANGITLESSVVVARKGENNTISAPTIANYALISVASTVLIPTNEETVEFYYTNTATAELTVRAYYVSSATGQKIVVYTSVTQENVGATVTANAPSIDSRYTLADSSTKTITISESSDNVIEFLYEYDDTDPNNIKFTSNHIAYIQGYEDGAVRPDGNLTRAQAATIFYNLLDMDDKGVVSNETRYSDVEERAWYYEAVTYLSQYNVIQGYPDGSFGPDQNISRAEFVTIINRINSLTKEDVTNPFSDVSSSHWAYNSIMNCYNAGFISGYPDGTFCPEKSITRAEAVTIVNGMLDRRIHAEDVPDGVISYTDITKSHWAYAQIAEASVTHEYERQSDGYEKWISW